MFCVETCVLQTPTIMFRRTLALECPATLHRHADSCMVNTCHLTRSCGSTKSVAETGGFANQSPLITYKLPLITINPFVIICLITSGGFFGVARPPGSPGTRHTGGQSLLPSESERILRKAKVFGSLTAETAEALHRSVADFYHRFKRNAQEKCL